MKGEVAVPLQPEAIRLSCTEKDIDLGPILQENQVGRLEELDYDSAQRLLDWIEGQ